MELIGTVARLQIQVASLKVQGAPREQYDPAGLRSVPALEVCQAGASSRDVYGAVILDQHHREHPHSKNRRGVNGISIGFTAHYASMRGRFGDHLYDGIAGENIIVATDRRVPPELAAGGLCIVTADGPEVRLEDVFAAEPCVPFTRFALRYPSEARSNSTVKEALAFLREGMRGYYATYRGAPATLRLGDRVYSL